MDLLVRRESISDFVFLLIIAVNIGYDVDDRFSASYTLLYSDITADVRDTARTNQRLENAIIALITISR